MSITPSQAAANKAVQAMKDESRVVGGYRHLDPEMVAGREILRIATERDRLALKLRKVRDTLQRMRETRAAFQGDIRSLRVNEPLRELVNEIAEVLAEVGAS